MRLPPSPYPEATPKEAHPHTEQRKETQQMKTIKPTISFILPLILAALLITSCSDYDNDYTVNQIRYEKAFLDAFGEIDPAQDWNLVKQLREKNGEGMDTRGAYPNANQYADKYVVPDALTDSQKEAVRLFFQMNQNPQGVGISFSDYFVQQVYRGGDNPEGRSSEVYYDAKGDKYVGGPSMNYLMAGSKHEHVNDFNNGTCSEKNNVYGNDGKSHSDQIMMMENSDTESFGYHNNKMDYYCYDRFVIIPGEEIEVWAKANGIACNPSLGGRYFVGLDFDMHPVEDMYTGSFYEYEGKKYPYISDNRNQYYGESVEIANSSYIRELMQNWDNVSEDEKAKYSDEVAIIKRILAEGYLPTQNNAWVKVGTCADGYYSDWIICVTEGIKKDDPTPRVTNSIVESALLVCEDLGDFDFDFNDIVLKLDHKLTITTKGINVESETDSLVITAMAAGGTLPSYVYYKPLRAESQGATIESEGDWTWLWAWNAFGDGDDNINNNCVHAMMGEEGNFSPLNVEQYFKGEGQSWSLDITEAINVIKNSPDPKIQRYANAYPSYIFDYSRIRIYVGEDRIEGKDNQTYIEPINHGIAEDDASAYKSSGTPQMMLLPLEFEWAQECVPISQAYGDFREWVRNAKKNTDWYRTSKNHGLVTLRDELLHADIGSNLRWVNEGNTTLQTITLNVGEEMSLPFSSLSSGAITINPTSPLVVDAEATSDRNIKVKALRAGSVVLSIIQEAAGGYDSETIMLYILINGNGGGNGGNGGNSGDGNGPVNRKPDTYGTTCNEQGYNWRNAEAHKIELSVGKSINLEAYDYNGVSARIEHHVDGLQSCVNVKESDKADNVKNYEITAKSAGTAYLILTFPGGRGYNSELNPASIVITIEVSDGNDSGSGGKEVPADYQEVQVNAQHENWGATHSIYTIAPSVWDGYQKGATVKVVFDNEPSAPFGIRVHNAWNESFYENITVTGKEVVFDLTADQVTKMFNSSINFMIEGYCEGMDVKVYIKPSSASAKRRTTRR